MKRKGNIYPGICSIENLTAAAQLAMRGKSKQYGVIQFNKDPEGNILKLHTMLLEKTFKTSKYDIFPIYEPKERMIYRLPFYPDRVVHWAVMLKIRETMYSTFTADTYSSIEGRGVHKAGKAVKKALLDVKGTQFCLKLDVQKFYPSVDHAILKQALRRKFKDPDFLMLLDEIIESAPGLPIGNLLSQSLSNFYLTPFDHWIKEKRKVRYYYRYADDIVILGEDKASLHRLFHEIKEYFAQNLKLKVKGNYQVFPVAARGIDFGGYVYYHTHTLLRTSIKKAFAKAVASQKPKQSIDSYLGWAKHANTINLTRKLLNVKSFKDFNIKPQVNHFQGDKISVYRIFGREIIIRDYKIVKSKFSDGSGKRLDLQIEMDGKNHVVFCGSLVLMDLVTQIGKENLPFKTTIVEKDKHYEFS